MVSKYDVFYVAATGKTTIREMTIHLKTTYQNIYKKIEELKKDNLIDKTITVIETSKTKLLGRLIVFCIKNNMSYNLMFKANFLNFIQKAAQKEYFTRQDVKIHGQTFHLYTESLNKYGLLLIISRNPLKCKLLRHSFFEDLLRYFGKEIKFYEPKDHSFIKPIKKELAKYRTNLKIFPTLIWKLERKQEIRFIHSSLTLEGNPITLPDTEKIIFEKIVPPGYKIEHIQEITNYKKAVDNMLENVEDKKQLDLQLILYYHKTAMYHIHGAGQLRMQNVKIKGNPDFKTADWQIIPARIKSLLEEYEKFKKNNIEEIIRFASYFHNEFQRIHPFIDGNSRTARLLMLHILRENKIPVMDIPLGYFDIYMNLTKKSKQRDDQKFQHLIEEITFFNIRKLNLEIK